MRFHPGVEPDKALFGYMRAMQGFTLEAIAAGIQKFLRGECKDVNPKYVPHPPELAIIVRTVVVPHRIPAERRVTRSYASPVPGERERMRLKMPLWAYARRHNLMDELAAANREGFAAMVVLASRWGIEVPPEFADQPEFEIEQNWQRARNRAWAEIEANPPPFMRKKKA